jgi:hypothetical protein
MDNLRAFNGDIATKEDLTAFITSYIEKTAIERMYNGEDVSHIKDAKELLDGAFLALEEKYAPPRAVRPLVNHAG